jgi:hypothetical protein
MGMASSAMQAAGIGFSMVSAYKQAQAQKALMRYQAKIAENNAQIARWQAGQATLVGQNEEQTSRLRTAQMFSAQRASMAANGIDLGEGSATDVLASTKYMGERDALTIRDNAARKAWGYNLQAQNYTNDAAMTNAGAAADRPRHVRVRLALGSADTVASIYKTYKGGT